MNLHEHQTPALPKGLEAKNQKCPANEYVLPWSCLHGQLRCCQHLWSWIEGGNSEGTESKDQVWLESYRKCHTMGDIQSSVWFAAQKEKKNVKKAAWEVIWSQWISVSLQRKYKVLKCSWMQRQKQWWGSEPWQLCIGNEAQGFSALSMTNPCNID